MYLSDLVENPSSIATRLSLSGLRRKHLSNSYIVTKETLTAITQQRGFFAEPLLQLKLAVFSSNGCM
jgi:hypothetical protein